MDSGLTKTNPLLECEVPSTDNRSQFVIYLNIICAYLCTLCELDLCKHKQTGRSAREIIYYESTNLYCVKYCEGGFDLKKPYIIGGGDYFNLTEWRTRFFMLENDCIHMNFWLTCWNDSITIDWFILHIIYTVCTGIAKMCIRWLNSIQRHEHISNYV